jgi:hypothetical protein
VDDCATTGLRLQASDALGHQERSPEVRRQDPVPTVVLDLEERLLLRDAGVVDEDVDPSPALVCRGHRHVDVGRAAHVGGVRPGTASALRDRSFDLGQRLRSSADQHHLGPLGREPLGDRSPDSLAGPRDDDVLLLEPPNGHDAPFT